MNHSYNDIISLKNLYLAWREFIRDKKNKKDVGEFALNLADNIYQLHLDLKDRTYLHGPYEAFAISDPKPRSIHKASVRDRLLHHAIYRVLYLPFDQQFIYDSYSCRFSKGTHRAIRRFQQFGLKVSLNNSRTAWVLKCDVRKFFASINHEVLMAILKKREADPDIICLLERVIKSFYSTAPGKGLPLGNLTSQLLVNIYMNEFDQFIKHQLKQKYYLRFADDFVLMHHDKNVLLEVLPKVADFLDDKLKLSLHPDKVFLKTLASGVDFLGWVNFPKHRVLRTATKKRMFRNIKAKEAKLETVQSYLGLLSHGDGWKLRQQIRSSLPKIEVV